MKINGRAKNLYSIAKKMRARSKLSRIYDLFAVRIILVLVNKNELLYGLGICSEFTFLSGNVLRLYFAAEEKRIPVNSYNTASGPEGKMVEIQIRTKDMHEVAEKALPAHWKYKENISANDKQMEDWISWIREMFESSAKSPRQGR